MKTVITALAVLVYAFSAAGAAECYEATASVKQDAPSTACTDKEKGYTNTGKGPLNHDGCTAAKAQARTKLQGRLTESCKKYVQTFDKCSVITVKSCS